MAENRGNIKNILQGYGFSEIRTPIVEQIPLFRRAIGEVTDVVEKKCTLSMTVTMKVLTLRPENTAGCVRAGIEHGLPYNQEQRLWYLAQCSGYERPQRSLSSISPVRLKFLVLQAPISMLKLF